ncbi:MAG: Uma2 family endonuclease [Bryobacteraceae bacterium]
MAFVIDYEFLPATLTAHPMSDEEFAEFCSEHPDLFFEMSARGELIVMAPTYSLTGVRNQEIGAQLRVWAKSDGRGLAADSSAGFVLPNGARRSPDASWTLKSRIEHMDAAQREKFWHLCPDFVIELKSPSDRPRKIHKKMTEYLANGAQLGWLIDPETRTVSVYRGEGEVETLTGVTSIAGEGPVAGFVLELSPVWNPLAG